MTNTIRPGQAAIAAGLLFFAVTIVEIFARPSFDIQRHAISVLSLGPRGWVMKATFLLSGLLTLACAVGLRRAGQGVAGPMLVALYGAGLVLAGLFDAPPGMGFPPGTPDDAMPVMTTGAIVHSIAFMLAFGSLTVATFVFARRFARGGDRGAATLSALSALAGVAMPALIAMGMASVVATGVAFYVAAMLAWIWLGWVAARASA